jgi:hypothetical protein
MVHPRNGVPANAPKAPPAPVALSNGAGGRCNVVVVNNIVGALPVAGDLVLLGPEAGAQFATPA